MNTHFIDKELKSLAGQSCCRVYVNEEYGRKRLKLGFGEQIENAYKKSPVKFFGEWDFGSYYASWRVIVNGKIITGSNQFVDDILELEKKLAFLIGKKIITIFNTSDFDVRVVIEGGVFVDYIWTSSEDDSIFIMFMRDRTSIEFRPNVGWQINS